MEQNVDMVFTSSTSSSRVAACSLLLGAIACGAEGEQTYKSNVSIEDASVTCNFQGGTTEDRYAFEAFTDGPVTEVIVCPMHDESGLDCWVLVEQNVGYWFGELGSYTLGKHCDEADSVSYVFRAHGRKANYDKFRID